MWTKKKRKLCNLKDWDSTPERRKQNSQDDDEREPLGDSWAAGVDRSHNRCKRGRSIPKLGKVCPKVEGR